MHIKDIHAVVAGGASGLGAACVRLLASHGARVTILDLEEAKGAALARDVGGRFERTDVCDDDQVERALAAGESTFGPLRILVTSAGLGGGGVRVASRRGPHPRALFERMMQVHALGTFNILRLGAARMSAGAPLEDGERGVIVTTSSIVAQDGAVGMIAYGAAKAAIEGMTLPAARDLAPAGIRVMCIAAGSFETPMTEEMAPELRAATLARQPFPKRFGDAAEFAELVKHICENRMLNGAVLRLDGALRLHVAN